MASHPWFHPTNVYAVHRSALELMVEVLEAAVNDSLPEGRRRHPLPGAIPGPLLSPLVRDTAREIALSKAFEGQTLRATPGLNMSLHLLTRDNLLRIRTRKLPDPEQPVPDGEQLELEFPDDYASTLPVRPGTGSGTVLGGEGRGSLPRGLGRTSGMG